MSEIAVNAITDASGGSTASINGYTPTVSNMAGRNRIINGGFDVWQRGTSFSVNATGTTATYTADRWCLFPANTGFTAVAQVVSVSGGGLRVNCTTAAAYATTADVLSLQQRVEGYNCSDLSGEQVTVSFKVKTNKTGNYGVTLYAADTSTWGTPQSITVSTADVETLYTLTFTAQSGVVAAATEGLRLVICLAAGTARSGVYYPTGGSQVNLLDNTSNYLEIKEVQLEAGSTATPFEHRQYGQELALCQRYYCTPVGFNFKTVSGRTGGTPASRWTTNQVFANLPTPVRMRTTPTITLTGSFGIYGGGISGSLSSVDSVVGLADTLVTGVFNLSVNPSETQTYLIFPNTNSGFEISAEL